MMLLERRGSLAAGLSLFLVLPTLQGWVSGNVSLTGLALRYLAALVITWLGIGLLGHLISGYGPHHDVTPAPVEVASETPHSADHPRRRADD